MIARKSHLTLLHQPQVLMITHIPDLLQRFIRHADLVISQLKNGLPTCAFIYVRAINDEAFKFTAHFPRAKVEECVDCIGGGYPPFAVEVGGVMDEETEMAEGVESGDGFAGLHVPTRVDSTVLVIAVAISRRCQRLAEGLGLGFPAPGVGILWVVLLLPCLLCRRPNMVLEF